jgi:hypothetical protein
MQGRNKGAAPTAGPFHTLEDLRTQAAGHARYVVDNCMLVQVSLHTASRIMNTSYSLPSH